MTRAAPGPTFEFEENRLIYELRRIAYPGDTFTSAESVRCAFAVFAARNRDRTRPKHDDDEAEWNRVLGILDGAEPKAWVTDSFPKSSEPEPAPAPVAAQIDKRIEEVERPSPASPGPRPGRATEL